MALASLAISLAIWAVPASASPRAVHPHASPPNPLSGVWAGSVTLTPAPACATAKPQCPLPAQLQLTVPAAVVVGSLGKISYPTWGCEGTFLVTAANSTELSFHSDSLGHSKLPCEDLEGEGTLTLSSTPGQATFEVGTSSSKELGTLSSYSSTNECSGSGSCDVTSSSPQVVCLTAASCPAGGTLDSTVTIGAFSNGALKPNSPVTLHFLSPSKAHDKTGSWCQAANGRVKRGRTNSLGLFAFSYTTAGKNPPPIASFCIMKATVGHSTIIAAIDETNDPADWTVTGSPTPITRFDVASAKANVHLYVKDPNVSPVWVYNDPTTIYSEIPSTVGACGSITPLVKKTGHPHGRATLVYTPSTVGGTPSHKVFCTLIGQEADTGAISNKVLVYQTKP